MMNETIKSRYNYPDLPPIEELLNRANTGFKKAFL